MVSKEPRDAKGLQQGFELQKHFVLAATENVGQDLTGSMIEGMPQPAGLTLHAHKTPHFIDFGGLHSVNAHFYLIRCNVFTRDVLTEVRAGPFH
jgi:hypothetical protein